MQKKLLLLSFIEGGAVMAAELCGAKLLAPVFGSSLYVWATVMGITLFALALGYFSGGWFSAKADVLSKRLFQVLNFAALFLVLMPIISYYLVPRLSYLPFLQGLVCSAGLLLFPAVFLLGASSPLFITLQISEPGDAGKVSGSVYAVSTLGGIIATFMCGFYLIPELGLQNTLFAFGLLLFFANWVFLRKALPGHFVLLVCCVYLNYQLWQNKQDVIYSSDSIMGKLVVKDVQYGKEKVRLLKINDIIQTEMACESKTSVSKYVEVIDSLVPESKNRSTALVLGLGGGLTSNLLVKKNYQTDAVEFDPRIIQASLNYFDLNKHVNYYCEDARRYLNSCKKKYDLILVDVFKAEEQPSYIITKESLERLKHNLHAHSRVLINWHGYSTGKNGMGTAILYYTLVKSGYEVKLCAASSDENQRNLIFVASLSTLPILLFERAETLLATTYINSDDAPRLERYNASANKTWRSLYLKFYQSGKN